MEKEQLLSAITKSRDSSNRRNFTQTFDLIVNLKGLDMKKQEHQVDAFIKLPNTRGKKVRVCALVGAELEEQAKSIFDFVIASDNFEKYKLKKDMRKIANGYDYFVAQANIMPKVATIFGRVFGPRGKMPNPKSGCVVTPNTNLKSLYEVLQRTIKIKTKSAPLIQCAVGTEDMDDNLVADNALLVYNSLVQLLPGEKNNIRDAYLKLTMGKPVKLE